MKERKLTIKISEKGIVYKDESNYIDKSDNELLFPPKENNLEVRIVKIFHKVLNNPISSQANLFDVDNFKTLGETLYKVLLENSNDDFTFKDIYNEVSRDDSLKCKIILEFDRNVDGLAELPWEYISYKQQFLTAYKNTRFEIIRRIIPFNSAVKPKHTQPANRLNILLIVANPELGNWHIDTKIINDGFNQLKKTYGDKINIFRFALPLYRERFSQGFDDFLKQFRAETADEPYIIHFYGHAMYKDSDSFLVFPNSDVQATEPDFVRDTAFENFFTGQNDLPMTFVLQACSSGKIMDYKNDKGIALRLASKLNIPAVVSMQNDINPETSTAFIKKMYESLLRGEDISTAVKDGRTYVATRYQEEELKREHFSDNFFGSPVLMLTSKEPPVFIKESSSDTPTQQSTTPSVVYSETHKLCANFNRGNPGCRMKVPMEKERCSFCQGTQFVPVPLVEDPQRTMEKASGSAAESKTRDRDASNISDNLNSSESASNK
jgi:hypothetical protein